jgi:hypothetical protein
MCLNKTTDVENKSLNAFIVFSSINYLGRLGGSGAELALVKPTPPRV